MPNDRKEYHKNYGKEYRKKHADSIKQYKKQWCENNKDIIKKYRKDYVVNNHEKLMVLGVKHRAKKKGVECTLNESDIDIPLICPALRKPIIREYDTTGKRGPKAWSPSVDRIDNTKGYTKDNIQIISHQANTMKGQASPEDLINFALWVFATYGKDKYEIRDIRSMVEN
jgi:hypothetical protein